MMNTAAIRDLLVFVNHLCAERNIPHKVVVEHQLLRYVLDEGTGELVSEPDHALLVFTLGTGEHRETYQDAVRSEGDLVEIRRRARNTIEAWQQRQAVSE